MEKYKNIILAIITIATAFIGLRTKALSDELDIQKKQIDKNASELDIALKQKSFDNDLKFRIYNEVKDALVKKDTTVQNVVVMIIEEMLADDSVFKQKLQNILLSSSMTANNLKTRIVKVQQTENEFNNTLAATMLAAKKDESTYRIDVFYLENVPGSRAHAQQVEKMLADHPALKKHIIKSKLLPKGINAQRGYLVSRNQIRYETSELDMAEELQKIITESKLVKETPVLHKVQNTTTNYVSVFIR